MILEKIVAHKRREVNQKKYSLPLKEIKRQIAKMNPCRPLAKALKNPKEITLIAEIKRASPSKGTIRPFLHPAKIARLYTEAGAAAISVLTEEKFFGGKIEFLAAVRKETTLPILRKDFIVDPYQIYESRFYGSDAILLIAAILNNRELNTYRQLALDLGLSCLVETHTKEDLQRALSCGAQIIGINNRNLYTFETDLNTTFSLRPYILNEQVTVVSESGINNHAHLLALRKAKVDSVLVGEALMRSDNIKEKIKELLCK